jgi:hypothetical protein
VIVSGGTGKPAVAYEAARSHARAAFLLARGNGSFRLSSVSLQLPASPMMILPIRIKHPLDVPVQRSHDVDAREHCRAARRRDQDQRLHCRLPCLGLVLGFGKLRDVGASVLQRDEATGDVARQNESLRIVPVIPIGLVFYWLRRQLKNVPSCGYLVLRVGNRADENPDSTLL